jgi:hypothetical protein
MPGSEYYRDEDFAPAPTQAIHPAPDMFSDEEIAKTPILRFFHYKHLPPTLMEVSKPFCELAAKLTRSMKPSAELSAALRKLLEAKDCAVRAIL